MAARFEHSKRLGKISGLALDVMDDIHRIEELLHKSASPRMIPSLAALNGRDKTAADPALASD